MELAYEIDNEDPFVNDIAVVDNCSDSKPHTS